MRLYVMMLLGYELNSYLMESSTLNLYWNRFDSWLQFGHGFCISWSFKSSFSVGFYVRLLIRTITVEHHWIQAYFGNALSGEDVIGHVHNADPWRP